MKASKTRRPPMRRGGLGGQDGQAIGHLLTTLGRCQRWPSQRLRAEKMAAMPCARCCATRPLSGAKGSTSAGAYAVGAQVPGDATDTFRRDVSADTSAARYLRGCAQAQGEAVPHGPPWALL